MNMILSNPIISEFLSHYPEQKHTNCLLGIILLGIYNLKTFSIDFEKILNQIETKQSLNTVHLTIKSLKQELSDLNSTQEKPGDTPRFQVNEKISEKRSMSFHKIPHKSEILRKDRKIPYKAFHRPPIESRHVKTPSIVNPDILTEAVPNENSEILQIADQFLNGRFMNEYINVEERKKQKSPVPKLGFNSEKIVEKNNHDEHINRPFSTGLSSNSHSGRYNSFSFFHNNRSVRGERNASYSKFW